jgi:hypothetical protein
MLKKVIFLKYSLGFFYCRKHFTNDKLNHICVGISMKKHESPSACNFQNAYNRLSEKSTQKSQ